jgi:hypothetical protein
MTIRVCKVRGTYGIGILMNPPIPVKAAKRATRLSSRALSQLVFSLSASNSTLLKRKRLASSPAGLVRIITFSIALFPTSFPKNVCPLALNSSDYRVVGYLEMKLAETPGNIPKQQPAKISTG